MITKLSHVSVFVLNQNNAYDFYVNKLGFKVHTDAPMGEGMRWLTVCPPEQSNLEITLLPITEGMMFDKDSVKQMRALVEKGTFGFGVFECHDLLATYEELKRKALNLQNLRPGNFTVMKLCLKMTPVIGFRWDKKSKVVRPL